MFPPIGPHTPYFGSSYSGIGSVLAMWPPISSPFVNITTTPKLVLQVAQARVVIDHGEPLDDDDNSFKRKHNPRMPRILLTRKPYNEKKGKPSLIKDRLSRQKFVDHFFQVGLQLYLRITTTKMKKDTLFEHKETIVICEESMGDANEY
jgi:hypothetical protein